MTSTAASQEMPESTRDAGSGGSHGRKSKSRSRRGKKSRKKAGQDHSRHHGHARDRDRSRRGRHSERSAAPHPPPGYYGPFGYMQHGMPWGPPVPYGMHMHALATTRSNMADDGVSMQVSEKFLMRNDYCQTFIDTGQRPQNFIRDLDYQSRYSEYPKIERLIKLKEDILAKRATPSMSLKCDLREFDLTSLGIKFDSILIDPPWEEYQTRVVGMYVPNEDLSTWTLDELRQLKIGEIADTQSFCFLWCGETHLEQGRELLRRWGFRRVEDICWVKTNRLAQLDERGRVKQGTVMYGDSSVLQRSKEHCIVGVKGTLKRSVDTHFIHANCDVDLIMEEEKEFGATQKPMELYETIEHFCLGRRRLELFGLDRNLRDGWLTLGRGLTTSNWSKSRYHSWFEGDGTWPEVKDYKGGRLLGSVPEIEMLRPKSPVRQGRLEPTPTTTSRRDAPTASPVEEDEKPLPEDLGEMAPPLPKEDDDDLLPPPAAPLDPKEMRYK